MEALQETELAGRVVADADMAEVVFDMSSEALGKKRRAVVGDQEGRPFQLTMKRLGARAGLVDRLVDLAGRIAGGEMDGQQIAREVVDHRDRVPPAMAGDVDIGHVGLPKIVGPTGQQLEQLGALVQLGRAHARLLQKIISLHHPVDLSVGDRDPPAATDHGDTLVAPPGECLGRRLDRLGHPRRKGTWPGTRFAPPPDRLGLAIPG